VLGYDKISGMEIGRLKNFRESSVDLVVKDIAFSLLWCRLDPWPGYFCILHV